jgi:molybdenum cofactor guanylyltransferase
MNTGLNQHHKPSVTAIILAGGQATRLDGADKGLFSFRNKPMIEHVLECITPQVDQVIINANRNIEQYQQLGHTVIADTQFKDQGPLTGIVNCLPHVDTDLAITIPCDMPLLPSNLVAKLLHARETTQIDLQVPFDGKRLQSGVLLLTKEHLASLVIALENQENAIRLWLENQAYHQVDFSWEKDGFANLNSFADVQAWASRLSH